MNHNFQLLHALYSSTSGKYLKFKVRFDKAIHNGRFYKLNKRKQSSLISRLKRLYERLKSLQTQLRIAGAGAAFALTLSVSNPAEAQNLVGPFERNDAANPLPPPYLINHPRLAVVDIDNDGDLDIFAGTTNGDIEFFRNTGTPTSLRRFTKVTGSSNPLEDVNMGYGAAPAFVDVDNDGDFDLLLGVNYPSVGNYNNYSPTFFFRNTGSATNPVFVQQTGASNPFNGITGSKYGPAIPVFVNMDADADLELFIGSSYSSNYGFDDAVKFYDNVGDDFEPASHNLTGYLSYFNNAAMTFADLDENGETDVIVSNGYGQLRTFVECSGGEFCEQTGPWDPATRTGNPMYNSYFSLGSPVLADFDGDGDLDLVVGQANYYYASVAYYENTDGAYTFESKNGLNISPLGGVDVGNDAAPNFIDIDNDGDLDAIIGSKYSSLPLSVFIKDDGLFIEDLNHPLVDLISYGNITPVFVDIDRDGDVDLFHGGGSITFFENTGSASNPVFTEQPNLFPTLNSGNSYDLSIAFIDLDGDGDKDALIGNDLYSAIGVLYFENTGSATAPAFTAGDAPSPFDQSNLFEGNPNVVVVDLDYDGDLDLAITETYYNGWYGDNDAARTRFFENTGSGEFTEINDPLITELTPQSITAFTDADGDGDLDAFVGNGYSFDFNQDGRVTYYENTGNLFPKDNSGPVVFNAISPGVSAGLNDHMQINGLPANNKVSIFNRWGDEVFKVSGYDNNNTSKRFEGRNDSGKDLPSGTYYYKIEANGKTTTGYLSLKR